MSPLVLPQVPTCLCVRLVLSTEMDPVPLDTLLRLPDFRACPNYVGGVLDESIAGVTRRHLRRNLQMGRKEPDFTRDWVPSERL